MRNREDILTGFRKNKDFMKEVAQNGIEKNRKGTARIYIKDKNGQPVANVKINAVQKTHEFKFGANIFMLDELETKEKNEQYKKYFADTFNMATFPFYWDSTEPEKGHTRYEKNSEKLYRRPPVDLCMEFCEKHGIEPREHALAYEHFFPEWLYNASVFEIKQALENRFREISERYSAKIPTIEVTNEMMWQKGRTSFYEEPDFIEWCFKTAEKYFPSNQLVANEVTDLSWRRTCRTTDSYYSYIEANMLKGARIDAVGMQFHMFFPLENEYENTKDFYDPINLYRHLDLYSRFGKPIQITEVTVPAYSNSAEDETIQAELIENLYTLWFSHPNVQQIIYWNLVDGYAAFAPQGDMTSGENYYYGGLVRFDMTPKPSYYAIKNLFEKKWHTETEALTDNDGEAVFRGFYGEYELKINVGNKVITKKINLSSGRKNTFTIDLREE